MAHHRLSTCPHCGAQYLLQTWKVPLREYCSTKCMQHALLQEDKYARCVDGQQGCIPGAARQRVDDRLG